MHVYRSQECGCRKVNNASLPHKHGRGIVLHHEGGALPNRKYFPADADFARDAGYALARKVQTYHIVAKGWRDTGYHFLVTREGLVLEGRAGSLCWAEQGEVLYGAHCGVTAYNADHFGICFEGNYMGENPTPEQWSAAVELCAQLCVWSGADSQEILGHRDVKRTLCPGDVLYRRLAEFRLAVRKRKLFLQGVK